tara:strand:- start:1425 stop:3797 length:2373 start_codon:yes stop_codon:yes gene_type:complete
MIDKLFKYLILLLISYSNILFANEFVFEASEIDILEKGNITKAKNGVKIFSNDGIEITGNELFYDKVKSTLKISGNVKIDDKKNNISTEGEKYIYYKDIEKIVSIGNSKSNIKNNYFLESSDLVYDRNIFEVYSEKKSKIEDLQNNIFVFEKFKFNLKKDILKAKKLSLTDNSKNQYYLDFALVNLKENKFLGSDLFIDFEDSLFGNNQNNPRLKGNSVISENNNTKVYKGNFTTCNQRDEKCPPWNIYAEEVVHKKKEQKIEYKNAWLKIYDKPIIYFPYFFHPDPTVKRQSGFLMPSFQNSNNSGTSIQIPYYKVISENKDLTFRPRIFFDDEILLQTEYRQANKNSDVVFDFSVNKDNSKTKNHIFADISSRKHNKSFDIHLEKVSNDNYLKVHNIKSPIVSNISTLYSYINYNSNEEDSSLNVNLEIYEDLNKNKTDRYEYILPNFNYTKNLNKNIETNGDLEFNSNGYQKNYNTNIDETVLINDIVYTSPQSLNKKFDGLLTNYKFLLRNKNSNSDNSNKIKNNEDYQLLSTFMLESKLPLMKKSKNFNNYLTPKFSARYSPNHTKNNTNLSDKIFYENVYLLDRVDNQAVEGGASLTLGLEYNSRNKNDENFINLSLANILRPNENPDLPKLNGLSEKRSNIIGNFDFIPSKFFNLGYEFSLDKNLDESNYNLLKSNFKVNNFITSFEYLEENNFLSDNSYLTNKTTFNFDKNYSISFATEKNLDQDITNYYNLIYEYSNDCLTAAIEYNKNYYTSGDDLKPEENFLFSIKIIPFGKISSPSLN